MTTARIIGMVLACAGAPVLALQPAAPLTPFAATGTVQYAFTPGDAVDSMIIAAIDEARQQILVQAYSFTHRRIADAIRARDGEGAVRAVANHYQYTEDRLAGRAKTD